MGWYGLLLPSLAGHVGYHNHAMNSQLHVTTESAGQAVMARVETAVAAWTDRARTLLSLTPKQLPCPVIRFDLRGRSAGQARLAQRRKQADVIRINSQLLATHSQEMIEVTVPHEVAHVAIYRRYGRHVRPHGPEWKALMRAFGVCAETCHALPTTPARRLKRFRYVCGCKEPAWLTSIRHRRAQNGTVYRCRRCRQPLLCAPVNTAQ